MNKNEKGDLFQILMVEDNPDDVELTRAAISEVKMAVNLNVVNDGVEAMAYLWGRGKYAGCPVPDLILLDLNMPRKNGREVLEEIKAAPALRRIPVVVLTTSSQEEDIIKAYDLHANCYITKPVDLHQFIKVIQTIDSFWLTIVKLPSNV